MENKDHIFDITNLHLEGDFNMQVQQTLQYIRLSRAEVEHLQILFDDLQEALQVTWPGCQVQAFGSIVTGLGIKSSDVDCFVGLPPWLQTPGDTYVNAAKATLKRRSHIFRELFAITGAKVPIVKFYHTPTGRFCDVSFKSPSGVKNSQLLAYLLNLDKRVLPLAILIKYWAKVHKFTGTNLMPNYALTLLVVFYLQQRTILPSVCQLQRNTVPNLVDNWNVNFEDVPHESDNNESLYDLLGGFFKYYRDFKYNLYIISPFLGRPVSLESFMTFENVPSEYKLYKSNLRQGLCRSMRLNSAVCIQDPFDHSRNCSIAMYPKLVKKIMTYIKLSAEVYENESSERFLWGILSIEVEESPVRNTKRPVQRGIAKYKPKTNNKRAPHFHKMFNRFKQGNKRS